MDMICPICREPWDNDELHEAVAEGKYPNYDAAYKAFRTKGCGEVYENTACKPDAGTAARLEVADLLGDDSDGYMAMMEDADAMGVDF